MKQKQHCPELTVMSGIAILFVLGIHGCGSALSRYNAGTMDYADADFLVRLLSNIVAPAVPMFLFVSGYKYALNDSETPYFDFLKKRLPRVIMSFAIIDTLFWVLDSIKYMESFDVVLLAKTYLHSWVGYSVAYQLWYIPMYCFVTALCPLVRCIIPSSKLRFCLYTIVGIIQRLLETDIPILATYPIRFLSYPVFFEMGVLAQERDWQSKITQVNTVFMGGTYIFTIVLLSWFAPAFSSDGLAKYLVYYFVGTAVFFTVSVQWKNSRVLQWLGGISYPVFLLHEPLIGRYISSCLGKVEDLSSVLHIVAWIGLNFGATIFLVIAIKQIKLDRLLWNYKI